MPLVGRIVNGKNRVVEKESGNIALNASGTPIDGGGHKSLKQAKKQATAVNLSKLRSAQNKG